MSAVPVGSLLREWRQRRRLSQLDLATGADISTRHLSYVETGRAAPSRAMVLHLAEALDVPLRERNALLTAAGFAPLYRERTLDDPALKAARDAVELVLRAHEPHPALAVDRHWNLLAHNRPMLLLLDGIAPQLLEPPVNVLRLSLHPQGAAPKIVNLNAWRTHLFARLRTQVLASGDPVLAALLDELQGYPGDDSPPGGADWSAVAVPLQIRSSLGVLSFISTTTVFGTPVDITLSELALETFFPADAETAQLLRRLGDGQTGPTGG
ncbi:helix-turn-helix transcriptional regulator [Rhizobacter sp. SG703]|uniref:helix-turn-helix domain-containing protein n=1 Tax=Rhizobacter sp. SG703 TaxID=2587140 RepID=UPI00144577BE|nr:helix-turn-helix transcriptional regulator [Rhizobacter sp. SG703]NKI92633.1 transcriptional regulator with XRE-family HTH domain [Rhizobacter sp. SG703]